MTTPVKIGLGIAAAALIGVGIYLVVKKKSPAAAGGVGSPPAGSDTSSNPPQAQPDTTELKNKADIAAGKTIIEKLGGRIGGMKSNADGATWKR